MFYSNAITRVAAFLPVAVAFLFTSGVTAQTDFLEEVIVTAQKREESIQDVPIAISALAGDKLDALNVKNTDDLLKVFPNLSVKPGGASNTGFSIRGVGTDNFHVTAQQAVGQYQDEVTLISPFVSTFGMFDLERVEVLRGPQNTLFGRNTTGGAVNIISRKPEVGGELDGYVYTRVGNEGRLDYEGAVTVPMGDTAAVRAAFQSRNRGGIYNNLANGEQIGDEERHSGRIQLAWEPSDKLRILANGHANFSRSDHLPYLASGLLAADGVSPCPEIGTGTDQFRRLNTCTNGGAAAGIRPALRDNPSTSDWNDVYDISPDVNETDFYGGFLRLEYDMPSFTVTSLSSWDKIEVLYQENLDGNTGAGFFPGQDAEYEVFQQELRLVSTHDGPLKWIFGGYYSYEDDTLATIIRNNAPGTPPFSVIPSIEIQQEVNIWSLYGKLDFDLTENLTLFGGLRWTNDSKEGISIARVAAGTFSGAPGPDRLPDTFFTDLDRLRTVTAPAAAAGVGCPGALPCQSPDLAVAQDIEQLGGKIGMNLVLNDNVSIYASFSRGFKSGAFDTRALAAFSGTADEPVDPEFLNAVEFGAKSEWLDGKLIFNASVFKYDWKDLQVFDVDSLGRPAFLNVPEVELKGFDAELKWSPFEGWYAQGGVGYVHSEIIDDGGLNTVANGAPLNQTPEWTFNGLIVKDTPIMDGNLSLQLDFQYIDDHVSQLDGDPTGFVESAFFLNARAAYQFGSEQQYEVAFWAQNITEEKTCTDLSINLNLTNIVGCTQNPGIAFYGGSFRYDF